MIKIDYDQTRACAHRLSGAADTCRQMNINVTKVINTRSLYWQGKAAVAFSAELSQWKKETASIQREMESLSAEIIRIANEFEEAEARVAAEAGAFGGGHSGSR